MKRTIAIGVCVAVVVIGGIAATVTIHAGRGQSSATEPSVEEFNKLAAKIVNGQEKESKETLENNVGKIYYTVGCALTGIDIQRTNSTIYPLQGLIYSKEGVVGTSQDKSFSTTSVSEISLKMGWDGKRWQPISGERKCTFEDPPSRPARTGATTSIPSSVISEWMRKGT